VEDDSQDLLTLITNLVGSPVQFEMAVRASQSLELTDGLWELVPLVVDVAQRRGAATPQDAADTTAAAARLDPGTRTKIRHYADQWVARTEATMELALPQDPAPDFDLTSALRDPVGFIGSIIDVPALAAEVMPGLITPFSSLDEQMYLQTYVRAVRQPSRTPQLLRAVVVPLSARSSRWPRV
jgi:hypothetical protein